MPPKYRTKCKKRLEGWNDGGGTSERALLFVALLHEGKEVGYFLQQRDMRASESFRDPWQAHLIDRYLDIAEKLAFVSCRVVETLAPRLTSAEP